VVKEALSTVLSTYLGAGCSLLSRCSGGGPWRKKKNENIRTARNELWTKKLQMFVHIFGLPTELVAPYC